MVLVDSSEVTNTMLITLFYSMNNTFYFLRHGKTIVDRKMPISKWVLSDMAEKQAYQLAEDGIFNGVDVIFSSTEEKAYQTAKPIADALKKEVLQLSEIAELNRDAGGFMEAEAYEKAAKYCLTHAAESISNWETAESALNRFSKKIEKLDVEYDNTVILIVGHGYTINMYFAKLLGKLDSVYERLETNSFADWGIVKNNAVVKDIVRS